MQHFLIQILNGVQLSMLVFLLAVGLTLIFGLMNILNLAHGSFFTMGAYFGTAEADTNVSTKRTIFRRGFFIGGNQYFTFSHEFRHLMPENQALRTPDYLRDRLTGASPQHPMEIDADTWAQKFMKDDCSCK